MGKVGKGVRCSVEGCSGSAARSLSTQRLRGSSLRVSQGSRRVYLCEAHLREWKKETRKSRELDRLRYA